jgi:hypothetical protein
MNGPPKPSVAADTSNNCKAWESLLRSRNRAKKRGNMSLPACARISRAAKKQHHAFKSIEAKYHFDIMRKNR